eukprot:scaffold7682_cov137-Skeletonema_dohrnii-CCMP3373.AAC.10
MSRRHEHEEVGSKTFCKKKYWLRRTQAELLPSLQQQWPWPRIRRFWLASSQQQRWTLSYAT